MYNVIIISSENVRPSSPTPQHNQKYELSMLDQISPPMPVPVVLYFPSPGRHDHVQLFKNSLSETLTRFFPFAGRIGEDGHSIDCNDQGVPFVIAKFQGHNLSDLLKKPDLKLPNSLVPCDVSWSRELGPGDTVMMIQLTNFDCGGYALSVVFWHKVADATTIVTFLDSWAATASGSGEPVSPDYISRSIFPPKQQLRGETTAGSAIRSILKTGKSSTRRFVFDSKAISQLKDSCGVERPTRVEVVSALLWKCFMAASVQVNGNYSASLLTHAVNLRRRACPPFPSNCLGNFPGLAAASSSTYGEIHMGELVKKMRDAINKIDGDFVSRMQGEDGLSGYSENLGRIWGDIPKGADHLSISSWSNGGFYSVEFGWGKPAWVTRCDAISDSDTFLNVVWLTDTRNGDGIEAWVTLDEKYMEVFENVGELRSLASVNPSPLIVHVNETTDVLE